MRKRILALCLLLLVSLLWGGVTASADGDVDVWSFLSSSLTPVHRVSLIRASVDGARTLDPEPGGHYLAQAMLDENSIVDHWEINGETVEGETGDTLAFDSDEVFTVEAVLRGRRSLNCVNCYFQFLNANGKAEGTRYASVVFEDDYLVPTTGKSHLGGSVSGQITANIPHGKTIDYWVINGAVYYAEVPVKSMLVLNIQEDTSYEVVLRDMTLHATRLSKLLETLDPTGLIGADGLGNPPAVVFDPNGQGKTGPEDAQAGADHTHNWVLDYETPGTCVSNGHRHFHCTICNLGWDDYPMGSHTWIWEHDVWGHWKSCTTCGTYTAYEPHALTAHTEGGGYYEECSVCGFKAYG